MAAETGFTIDGEIYEIPVMNTFDTDEWQVLYDYSGLTLQDFVPPADLSEEEFSDAVTDKTKNPGFLRALMHIAYRRANPKQNPSRVKALIGQANMVSAIEHLGGSDEEIDDDLPPVSTTELEPSSPRSSVVSNEISGDDSPKSSDVLDYQPVGITTRESGTSSTSVQETSEP